MTVLDDLVAQLNALTARVDGNVSEFRTAPITAVNAWSQTVDLQVNNVNVTNVRYLASLSGLAVGQIAQYVQNGPVPFVTGVVSSSTPVGGSKPFATILVAAANSSAADAASADYVCDGVADEVEINAAIQALYDAGGGKLLLLEGTFHIANAIQGALDGSTGRFNGITIEGMGRGATILFKEPTPGGFVDFLIYGFEFDDTPGTTLRLAHLTCDGNNDTSSYGVYLDVVNLVLDDVEFKGLYHQNYAQVEARGDRSRITGCFFRATSDVGAYHLYVDGQGSRVSDCTFEDVSQYEAGLIVASPRCIVSGCTFRSGGTGAGALLLYASNTLVDSCIIYDFDYGVNLTNIETTVRGCTIVANVLAINTASARSQVITGNTITAPQAIEFLGAGTHFVSGNYFLDCGTGSIPVIRIEGAEGDDCVNVAVIGNKFYSTVTLPDYCVEIDSGAINTLVTMNDFIGAYNVDAILDTGTGTDIGAGNRTT